MACGGCQWRRLGPPGGPSRQHFAREEQTRLYAHLDAGDFVVVINAEKVRLTGKKETDKEFMSYSGWKGGEKYATVAQVRARHPGETHHPRRAGHGAQEPPRPRPDDQTQSL